MKNRYNRAVADIAYNSWRGAIEKRRYKQVERRKINRFKDHKGKWYSSIAEMCKAYNVSIRTFLRRTKMGEPLKFILEKIKDIGELNAIKIKDHLGKEFKSKRAMCKHWGVSESTFASRIKSGMSIEEALTKPVKGRCKKNKTKQSDMEMLIALLYNPIKDLQTA